MRYRFSLLLLAGLALPAAGQPTQTAEGFKWSGRIPSGGWIRVKNMNGGITVDQASGDQVEIVATKRWRKGDPAVVRFDTKKFGSGGENVRLKVCVRSTVRPIPGRRSGYVSAY